MTLRGKHLPNELDSMAEQGKTGFASPLIYYLVQ